jgi:ATPase subunit of ABC transporter with duplicated ATPase domains
MGSISLNKLSLTLGTELFNNLDLVVSDGDRVGLVAANGAGKSSLLRIIAGELEPSAGDITRSRGLTIGHVEQEVPAELLGLSLRDAVAAALPAEQRETDGWRADVALDGFEAPWDMRDRPVGALSGGWQRLMLIARMWVAEPDALLMDEPTNHLDLGKIMVLEDWLNRVARGLPMIVASHDRAFLDAVTNRTLFLRPGTSQLFPLPFSAARAELAREDATVAARGERELKEAGKLRKQAAKLKNIGINSGSDLLLTKTRQLKERAAQIEENVQAVHKERSGEIRLANSGTHARLLLGLENLTVATPAGQALFRIDKLHIFQGDRIVLLGRNGTGKTQLVRMMHRAVSGEAVAGIRVTPSLVAGYADQDMSQLPGTMTPEELISGQFRLPDARVRSLLAAAGFDIERQARPISRLSLGQKARLGLLALRLTEPNFYLMDEPTNHVDIAGQEALEAELLAHGATAVLVSHDRSFVRAVGTRYLEIDGRKLRETEGPDAFFAALAADLRSEAK